MKKLFAYLFLIIMLPACEEKADWDLKTMNQDIIVVDGIITNELKVQTITLSKPVSKINEEAQPVTGATMLVSSEQFIYTFHEDPLRPGNYLSDSAFSGLINSTYSLLIASGNKVYSSKAELPPPAEFTFIGYEKDTDDNQFHITNIPLPFIPVLPAIYEIQLDWSEAPGYADVNPDSCKAKLYYYTLPTLDVSEVFAPTTEKRTFPAGTVITERRYSLTDEHAAFIRAVLLETTWQGGFFNTASANIPTNLSEGAKGFFGACGVAEKHKTVE